MLFHPPHILAALLMTATALTPLTRADDWKHGQVEVRAEVPSGRGAWPACGGIDIMEFINHVRVHQAAPPTGAQP